MTTRDRKAEKNGVTAALPDDSQTVPQVLKNVLARCQGDLPLVKGTGRGFFKSQVPPSHLPTEAGLTGVLILFDEVHLYRQVLREFAACIRDVINGLVGGHVDVTAGIGCGDVGCLQGWRSCQVL
jgi:hypothetical protein